MKFEIKNRFSGELIFSIETDSWKLAVEAAIKAKSNLSYANLSSANLRYADLRYADLRYANLSSANLRYADLRYADLRYADLRYANLSSANLSSANLSYANLSSANLRYADLRYADLSYANLSSANLSSANLRYANLSSANLSSANLRYADLRSGQLVQFRDDIWAVLSSQPLEVIGLRQALVDGKINGSSYEGECACLVGTIAKVANKKYDCLPVLKPNQSRPAEIFFMLINIGDVPEKSKWSKMAVEWIDEWSSNMQMAFGKK